MFFFLRKIVSRNPGGKEESGFFRVILWFGDMGRGSLYLGINPKKVTKELCICRYM